jgi:CubicO group peptidase (beta-lactamase class C family)
MKDYIRILGCCLLNLLIITFGYTQSLEQDLQGKETLQTLIDSVVQAHMINERIPGVGFALVKDGKLIFEKAYGFSDLENSTPVDAENTLFRIGSISKVITGIALLQLVESGKIKLTDDVNKFLEKELKINDGRKRPVLIADLLSHSAGFDQDLRNREFESPYERPSLHDVLKGKLVRVRNSGTVSCYDTWGITLAGYIIEKVSGKEYADYVKENVFSAGMETSRIDSRLDLSARLAQGYAYDFESKEYLPQTYEWYATTPASSADATVRAMSNFMIAILGDGSNAFGRLLSAAMVNDIKKNNSQDGYPRFKYSFWENYWGQTYALTHGGDMMGFTSNMYLIPQHNLGIYIVFNRSRSGLQGPRPRLSLTLPNLLMERWFLNTESNKRAQPSERKLIPTTKFHGTYADNLYCHNCYEGEEDAPRSIFPITAKDSGQLEIRGETFWAISDDEFESANGRKRIKFISDQVGNVRYLTTSTSTSVFEKLNEALIKETLNLKNLQPVLVSPMASKTYRGMQEYTKAIPIYHEIIKMRPNDGPAHHYLGICYQQIQDYSNAIHNLSKCYELGTYKSASSRIIAEIFARDLKDAQQAIVWIKRTIESGNNAQRIRTNPAFKDLQNHPQFIETVKGN